MTRKFSFHPMEKGVTIIIPTLNGGSIFPQCLAAIKGQENADPLQLIVIDSGSTLTERIFWLKMPVLL
jgi:glycosyltransferase involved in cell wall biosynthesis